MQHDLWTSDLHKLFHAAVARYREGRRGDANFFTSSEMDFLAGIGLKPIQLYDFAEDHVASGSPDWETVLLMTSARRDFFFYKQNAQTDGMEISESALPPKQEALDGIPWLPRIFMKAQCFLEGTLCHDIMFGCSGDRRFLQQWGLHPADFLRATWAAKGDSRKILAFIRQYGSPSA